jgi:hypothetical protein
MIRASGALDAGVSAWLRVACRRREAALDVLMTR